MPRTDLLVSAVHRLILALPRWFLCYSIIRSAAANAAAP
jgi:hypothetical protein